MVVLTDQCASSVRRIESEKERNPKREKVWKRRRTGKSRNRNRNWSWRKLMTPGPQHTYLEARERLRSWKEQGETLYRNSDKTTVKLWTYFDVATV
jgi:hypothetical protein